MKPEGLRLHANLILESAFYPSLSDDNQCRLNMKKSLKDSPEKFLLSLRKVVDEIEIKEGDSVEVGRLKRDIYRSALILADEETLQCKRVDDMVKQTLYSSVAAAPAPHHLQNEDPRTKAEAAKSAAAPSRGGCLLYTSPSPRDKRQSRMPSSA